MTIAEASCKVMIPPLKMGPFWMKYISMSYLISKLHQPVDAVVYVLNF